MIIAGHYGYFGSCDGQFSGRKSAPVIDVRDWSSLTLKWVHVFAIKNNVNAQRKEMSCLYSPSIVTGS